MRRLRLALPVLAVVGLGGWLAYPLDGYEYTGIRRLRAYRMIQDGEMRGSLRLPPGARLSRDAIRLRLADGHRDFDIDAQTPRDSALQEGMDRIVGRRHPSYRAAILDITDPARPRYAAVRGDEGYIPGSVGKLLVMTGLFNELAERFPGDTAARADLLRTTEVTADRWVIPNSHEVPVVAADWSGVTHRAVRVGDRFTLWEWVDHMVSPSSNAAASMVWKQAMLLDRFGARYPPSDADEAAYFRDAPKPELTALSVRVVETPLLAAGLDTAGLKIRTFFTGTASRIVPGEASLATPNQVLRWLIRLEQGRLVDRWSSLEMKKLMYFTRRRYRYASSPALADAAVYFKSGSLYECRPEPGYQCGQYRGNTMNLMHTVAIVESPAVPGPDGRQRVYLISMMSNVLKVNAAAEHQEIGTRVEQLIRALNP